MGEGLKWLRGYVCWWLACKLGGGTGLRWRLTLWLLPWAGDYAYWDDPWVVQVRRAERRERRTGLLFDPELDWSTPEASTP